MQTKGLNWANISLLLVLNGILASLGLLMGLCLPRRRVCQGCLDVMPMLRYDAFDACNSAGQFAKDALNAVGCCRCLAAAARRANVWGMEGSWCRVRRKPPAAGCRFAWYNHATGALLVVHQARRMSVAAGEVCLHGSFYVRFCMDSRLIAA